MTPRFAVVGHPNKGKSSVVSTLARDDSIAVSMRSGTTTESSTYTIALGDVSYALIDTPGFQRPRKVLAWLQRESVSADKRAERVRAFIEDPECQQSFKDEVELLRPILEGAAILYVVDGSRPYSVQYEAEMEILRWCGQPSMALINPIENSDFVEQWQQALQQYFRVVRVFDAVQADLAQHISLLEAFVHLHQPWSEALKKLMSAFEAQVQQQCLDSAGIAAKLLSDLCAYQVSQKAPDKAAAQALQPLLHKRYLHWMRQCEQRAHQQLLQLYSHRHLDCQAQQLELPDDLFDMEKWYAWGLSRKQLAAVAGIAGAATGGAVDLTLAGQSLMLGAIGGGLLGSGSAWFGAEKLARTKLKGLPLGGFEARQGPVSNKNFPYVVLARFLFLQRQLVLRNHAQRDALVFEEQQISHQLECIEKSERKEIYKALDRLVRQKDVDDLAQLLAPLFTDEGES